MEFMELPKHAYANRSYEDFDPLFVWRREEGRDTLELHLPGFKRDQIRIQINHVGLLVISGERHYEGNRWKRFKKEFEIPSYCNEDAIHGNMMQSILSVVMPKKSSVILEEEQEMKENNRKRESEISEENDITDHAEYQFEEKDDERVPQETTRDVALKFMLVMVLILVAASYISDVSKSLMVRAASYFHN